ncbi:ATP-binding protein [uncultured Streptomyces sp.]|uniref:ATP-binding protein n=1 Tax=uncultured Streptomyces sp. TaxID=174707 RepID=UPI002624EA89|nr:ATP-binding protein [uncultured Streptomyces sp.]
MIGEARSFADMFLHRAVTRGVAVADVKRGDALLVVSELVTNVVRYAPGPCTLALGLQNGLLEIAVSDTSGRSPQPQPFEPGRIGQHGLEIVLALCTKVDTEIGDRGKTVRACLTVL